jgi:hypothetical protein
MPLGPSLSRRDLVAALGVASVAALSGCTVRLEDGVTVPFKESAPPVPGGAGLAWLQADTRALAAQAPGRGALKAQLATVHAAQQAVLASALAGLALPAPSIPPAPPSSAAASKPAGPELAAYAAVADLVSVAVELRPLVCALLAQRCAAARLLGTPATLADNVSPVEGPALDQPVQRLAATIFWMEVIAARSSENQRALALSTRDRLKALLVAWAPAAPGFTPQLGYPLPAPAQSAEQARDLASTILRDLIASWGGAYAASTQARSGPALRRLPLAVAVMDVEAYRWGAALSPFPGLNTP